MKNWILVLFLMRNLLPTPVGVAGEVIQSLDKATQQKMKAIGTWKLGCPVPLSDLRKIKISYLDFEARPQMGLMVVHRKVAEETVKIFSELEQIKFPIAKIQLIDAYRGSDEASMEANNTSAFNCRPMTGKPHVFSKHSEGMAIDLNPLLNPYLKPKDEKQLLLFKNSIPPEGSQIKGAQALLQFCLEKVEHCFVLPPQAREALFHLEETRGSVTPQGKVVAIFKKYGWQWGGDWPHHRTGEMQSDLQHFEKDLKP